MAAERANAQSDIRELCEALGVPAPMAAGSGYEFELPIKLVTRDGTEAQGFVDCDKAGNFRLEAKDGGAERPTSPCAAPTVARAVRHEAQAERFVPTATSPNGHPTEYRDFAIRWRRLALRLYRLSLASRSIVRSDD